MSPQPSHDLDRRRGDVIVFMADGRIVEQGPPKTLFANPQSDRLRALLRRHHEAYLLWPAVYCAQVG